MLESKVVVFVIMLLKMLAFTVLSRWIFVAIIMRFCLKISLTKRHEPQLLFSFNTIIMMGSAAACVRYPQPLHIYTRKQNNSLLLEHSSWRSEAVKLLTFCSHITARFWVVRSRSQHHLQIGKCHRTFCSQLVLWKLQSVLKEISHNPSSRRAQTQLLFWYIIQEFKVFPSGERAERLCCGKGRVIEFSRHL